MFATWPKFKARKSVTQCPLQLAGPGCRVGMAGQAIKGREAYMYNTYIQINLLQLCSSDPSAH